VGEDITE